jgi:hypothetical protein
MATCRATREESVIVTLRDIDHDKMGLDIDRLPVSDAADVTNF